MILLMDATGLTEHDKYVCHNYRDPFKYRVLGYAESDIVDGLICTPRSSPIHSNEPASSKMKIGDELNIEIDQCADGSDNETILITKCDLRLLESEPHPEMVNNEIVKQDTEENGAIEDVAAIRRQEAW